MKKIGLSLFQCFFDMAKGEVKPEDVEKVICGTRAATPMEWSGLMSKYDKKWGLYATKAKELICQFLSTGRIEQPRLHQGKYAFAPNGEHWVCFESEIKWKNV